VTDPRQAFGRWGEDLAAHYLQRRGYEILARNVRTEYGEIDLIARERDMLVFVEVKARRTQAFGWPEAAVGTGKQSRLLTACRAYLQAHPDPLAESRIDVIAILQRRPGAKPELVHFEDAIHA
jgi:putative endonuclease